MSLQPQTTSPKGNNLLPASVGICAYNEEGNIAKVLNAITIQKTNLVEIKEIIVVSSGSTDRTDEIIDTLQKSEPRIILLREKERKGKASAVNLFLAHAKQDILILCSADVIPEENSLEMLCLPFFDARIGMTGAHPVPVDDPRKFMGFAVNLDFELHHKLNRFGELVAFRNIGITIPDKTPVDEASIEAMIRDMGYNLEYVPEAIVYNKGADTVAEWIRQRRRIYAGHLYLKNTTKHEVSSMKLARLAKLVLSCVKPNWRSFFWIPAVVFLELYSRLLGAYDYYVKKKQPYIWDISSSTKVVTKQDDHFNN